MRPSRFKKNATQTRLTSFVAGRMEFFARLLLGCYGSFRVICSSLQPPSRNFVLPDSFVPIRAVTLSASTDRKFVARNFVSFITVRASHAQCIKANKRSRICWGSTVPTLAAALFSFRNTAFDEPIASCPGSIVQSPHLGTWAQCIPRFRAA